VTERVGEDQRPVEGQRRTLSLVSGDFRDTGHIDVVGIDANNNLKLYTNDGTGHLADSGIYMLGSNGAWAGFR
jgi:hypothetical protein